LAGKLSAIARSNSGEHVDDQQGTDKLCLKSKLTSPKYMTTNQRLAVTESSEKSEQAAGNDGRLQLTVVSGTNPEAKAEQQLT